MLESGKETPKPFLPERISDALTSGKLPPEFLSRVEDWMLEVCERTEPVVEQQMLERATAAAEILTDTELRPEDFVKGGISRVATNGLAVVVRPPSTITRDASAKSTWSANVIEDGVEVTSIAAPDFHALTRFQWPSSTDSHYFPYDGDNYRKFGRHGAHLYRITRETEGDKRSETREVYFFPDESWFELDSGYLANGISLETKVEVGIIEQTVRLWRSVRRGVIAIDVLKYEGGQLREQSMVVRKSGVETRLTAMQYGERIVGLASHREQPIMFGGISHEIQVAGEFSQERINRSKLGEIPFGVLTDWRNEMLSTPTSHLANANLEIDGNNKGYQILSASLGSGPLSLENAELQAGVGGPVYPFSTSQQLYIPFRKTEWGVEIDPRPFLVDLQGRSKDALS